MAPDHNVADDGDARCDVHDVDADDDEEVERRQFYFRLALAQRPRSELGWRKSQAWGHLGISRTSQGRVAASRYCCCCDGDGCESHGVPHAECRGMRTGTVLLETRTLHEADAPQTRGTATIAVGVSLRVAARHATSKVSDSNSVREDRAYMCACIYRKPRLTYARMYATRRDAQQHRHRSTDGEAEVGGGWAGSLKLPRARAISLDSPCKCLWVSLLFSGEFQVYFSIPGHVA